ncbi:hypothetical protein V2J09_000820 [Rumex salicifolius]
MQREKHSKACVSLGFGAITWGSKKPEIVALSSLEAVYGQLEDITMPRKLLVDLGSTQEEATQL